MNTDALRLLLFTTASNLKQRSPFRLKPPSLHRCPPCRSFSPKLIDFYNSCKDDLEIVFVSSDRDDKSFEPYFGKMPWLSMMPGYTSREHNERQTKLAQMFQIQGIPSVIVLDGKTGNFITDTARTEVMKADTEESKKALIQSWLSKEAVPIEEAVFGTAGGDDSLLMWAFKKIATNPVYLIGMWYLLKKLLKHLEELGKDEIEGNEL